MGKIVFDGREDRLGNGEDWLVVAMTRDGKSKMFARKAYSQDNDTLDIDERVPDAIALAVVPAKVIIKG